MPLTEKWPFSVWGKNVVGESQTETKRRKQNAFLSPAPWWFPIPTDETKGEKRRVGGAESREGKDQQHMNDFFLFIYWMTMTGFSP